MGMERIVTFAEPGPQWPAIRERLAAAGHVVQMRLIDNLPAFPDEEPPPDWKELRVTLGHGMITLRRGPGAIHVIVWGNAEEATQGDQEAIVQALG
jgi:hypothetical protein